MGWSKFFDRAKWDRERREELDCYVELETRENLARGMEGDEARAAARKKLGNQTRIREEIYGMNTIQWLDGLVRDLRYAARGLRKAPTFTCVALLTLALGIGANTAVFSVIDAVLLKPLDYPQPEQLVGVWHVAPGAPGLASVAGDLPLSASMFFTYARYNRSFQAIGVWTQARSSVTGLLEPEQVRTAWVSDGVLQALDVPPAAGRWLNAADQDPAARRSVVLSFGYWQRRWGGDHGVVGRVLTVDSRPAEVVGVMPEGFRIVDAEPDLILPYQFDQAQLTLSGFGHQGLARLKPGVTIAQANADLARMYPIWEKSWPSTALSQYYVKTWRIAPAIRPLKRDVVGNAGDHLWPVMGTIGLVMLIACANIANLLLVRGDARRRELAIRAALGAGWGRIARELMLESLLLGLAGGAAGIAVAQTALHYLVALGPANLPRIDEIKLDPTGLLFALALALGSGLLFGSAPVLKFGGRRALDGIRRAGWSTSGSRARHVLVVMQVAMALVLLVGAGLMIRTFAKLELVDPGFTGPEQIETMRISIPSAIAPQPEQAVRMQQEILSRVSALPGVQSVGFTVALPLEGLDSNWDEIFAEGETDNSRERPVRLFKFISPGFLQTMGTHLISGREFTWPDAVESKNVVVVSENLARELWGSPGAAIGKRLQTAPGTAWREVIGVAEDVRNNGREAGSPPTVYWPSRVDNMYPRPSVYVARGVALVIRSSRAGTASFREEARRAIWSVNANSPIASVETMADISAKSLARTSFTLSMLAIAAGMALLLGVVGVYGAIAYAVQQRSREMGIRLALGAKPARLRRVFLQQGLGLAALGAALGVSAAGVLMRLMKPVLFGISPLDPLTYAAVTAVLIAAAGLASYVPARRASAVDPMTALKHE